jgi:hypothetical protein
MTDERAMTVYDFTRRGGVVYKTLHLPHGLALSREQVWNEAERAETRKNSTVARECEISLPMELDLKTQISLANELGLYLVEKHGCAIDVNVHQPTRKNDPRNTHAHILMTTRRLNPEGVLGEKCRELDAAKTGGLEITAWREHWAMICNRELQRAGLEHRIDHRSFVNQGLDLVPTIHEGTGTSAGLRRQINDAARAANQEAAELDEAIKAALLERAHLVAAQIVADATVGSTFSQRSKPAPPVTPMARHDPIPFGAENLKVNAAHVYKTSLATPATPIEPVQTMEQMRHALKADLRTLQMCAETARIGRVRLQTAKPDRVVSGAKKTAPEADKQRLTARRAVSELTRAMGDLGFFGRIFYKRGLEDQLRQARDQEEADTKAFNALNALAMAHSKEQIDATLASNADTIKKVTARAGELEKKIATLEAATAKPVPTPAPDPASPDASPSREPTPSKNYPRPRGF